MENGKLKIEDRKIAKAMVRCIPIELGPEEIVEQIDRVLYELKRMPEAQKIALKAAYVFAQKVPLGEREDMFQWLSLKLLEAHPESEAWAYTIARSDWIDWYRRYKTKCQYSEIDLEDIVAQELETTVVSMHFKEQESPDIQETVDTERVRQYNKSSRHIATESLLGLVEYDNLDSQLSAKAIIDKLPESIMSIAKKRLAGQALVARERQRHSRWLHANPDLVMQAQQV